MTDPRQILAREFERLSQTFDVGLSLGTWAGRGDWAKWSQVYRTNSGQRALTELDALIARLTEFRGRLAAEVAGSPRHGIEQVTGAFSPVIWSQERADAGLPPWVSNLDDQYFEDNDVAESTP
jgi:hypothetical protein